MAEENHFSLPDTKSRRRKPRRGRFGPVGNADILEEAERRTGPTRELPMEGDERRCESNPHRIEVGDGPIAAIRQWVLDLFRPVRVSQWVGEVT
jgi:hypothetical protein